MAESPNTLQHQIAGILKYSNDLTKVADSFFFAVAFSGIGVADEVEGGNSVRNGFGSRFIAVARRTSSVVAYSVFTCTV